jgi:cell division protein ZapA
LRVKFGEVGDTRLTIMAAITVADELSEALKKVQRLEQDLAGAQNARNIASDRARAAEAAVAETVSAAAERVEGIAKKLNQSLGNGNGVALG